MSTSKKIPANQAKTTKQQLGEIAEKVTVPTEINENEKHLYHVLIVEGKFNQSTLTTKYKGRVQMFNYRSWLTVKKRLKQIGITHAHIIHNPNKEQEEAAKEIEAKKEEYEINLNIWKGRTNLPFEEFS